MKRSRGEVVDDENAGAQQLTEAGAGNNGGQSTRHDAKPGGVISERGEDHAGDQAADEAISVDFNSLSTEIITNVLSFYTDRLPQLVKCSSVCKSWMNALSGIECIRINDYEWGKIDEIMIFASFHLPNVTNFSSCFISYYFEQVSHFIRSYNSRLKHSSFTFWLTSSATFHKSFAESLEGAAELESLTIVTDFVVERDFEGMFVCLFVW